MLTYLWYISCLLTNDTVCQGGYVDDFLSHLMCCCCALVQEWREVEIRGASGMGIEILFPLFSKPTRLKNNSNTWKI